MRTKYLISFRREFQFSDNMQLEPARDKVVNTFRQRANSVVLEWITQYNNRDVKARRRKERHHSGDRSQPVGRPVASRVVIAE